MSTIEVTSSWLGGHVGDCSAGGIAAAVTDLVRRGELEIGAKLPTVRALATHLGVSPGTVSAAWLMLRRRRIIITRRRGGTTVIGLPGAPHPRRFESVGNFGDRPKIDLTFATPDPQLLPALRQALVAALEGPELNTYTQQTITPRLREALEPHWPFPATDWMAVNGGYEGVFLLCQTNISNGELVAVEDPTAPRLLDILSIGGARPVAVACDDHGPLPESLHDAQARGAVAFIYQPRAQNPRGHHSTATRARQLARVLSDSTTMIIEDDGVGDVAAEDIHSIGRYLPDRTVHVRSYSKPFGPDLRIGVVAGAARPIEQARAYRNFSARWTSRILQDALAWLIADPASMEQVARARTVYAQRRARLAEELRARGIEVAHADGLSIWLPVQDERYALITLAAHGIAASAGSHFFVDGGPSHIRIATSHLKDRYDEVAHSVALAARPTRHDLSEST